MDDLWRSVEFFHLVESVFFLQTLDLTPTCGSRPTSAPPAEMMASLLLATSPKKTDQASPVKVSARSEAAASSEALNLLTQEHAKEKKEKTVLEKRLSVMEKLMNGLRGDLEKSKKSLEKTETEREGLLAQVQKLTKQNEVLQGKLNSVQELADLKETLADLNTRLSAENNKLKQEIAVLKSAKPAARSSFVMASSFSRLGYFEGLVAAGSAGEDDDKRVDAGFM